MGNLSLFSGKTRRWLQILTELGSFNLNFSSEATSQLISSLALQIGPASPEEDHLGDVHRAFLDRYFCQGLLAQLNWRMEVKPFLSKRDDVQILMEPLFGANANHITLDYETAYPLFEHCSVVICLS